MDEQSTEYIGGTITRNFGCFFEQQLGFQHKNKISDIFPVRFD